MKREPPAWAFEIGYDSKGSVIDHSETYFCDLPGTPAFARIIETRRDQLTELQREDARESIELMSSIQKWVAQPAVLESVRLGNTLLEVDWRTRFDGIGSFSLFTNAKLCVATVLVSGKPMADWVQEETTPQFELLHVLGTHFDFSGTRFEQSGAFNLINMTRRPLIISIFWPPHPDELSPVRTVQRMIAYSFFKNHHVVR